MINKHHVDEISFEKRDAKFKVKGKFAIAGLIFTIIILIVIFYYNFPDIFLNFMENVENYTSKGKARN